MLPTGNIMQCSKVCVAAHTHCRMADGKPLSDVPVAAPLKIYLGEITISICRPSMRG
jgi:hypothetical protein